MEIALAAADGRNVVVIGATVARAAIDEGLIDEIVVHLAPVLLGEGVRLFEGRPSTPVKLERTALAESGDITDLWFRVLKENAPRAQSGGHTPVRPPDVPHRCCARSGRALRGRAHYGIATRALLRTRPRGQGRPTGLPVR